ncbi:MAG: response regulator [Lachnospiraceae bacterium]|nr:response regulator [Lachnospiraceae bacterium]
MHTIMLIDDDQTQLIMYQKALDSGYRSMAMERGKNALEYLRKANKLPSLIVLDIDMPVMNGFEVFSALTANKDTKNIPVIFVSGNDDPATEMEAYALGAVDYMVKPVSTEILRRKVDLQINMLERRKRLHSENAELLDYNEQLQDYNNELQAMANESVKNVLYMQYFLTGVVTELLAKKDGFAAVHSKRVARFMDILVKQMIAMRKISLQPNDLDAVKLATQLFDMGKIGLPDYLLVKEGKYSQQEFETMQRHTIYAAESVQKYAYLLPQSNFVSFAYQICRSHHEKWDGTGYPDRLAGANIPILARMVSLCDIYDALVSERAYKKAMTHEQAYAIINQSAGVQLDPDVVAAFNAIHGQFYEISRLPIE